MGALTAAQNFNESILQSMTDGLLVVDTLGRATLANRAVERMLGYESGELFGKSAEEIFGPNALGVQESLEREAVMAPREVVLPRKTGGQIPVEIHLSPLPREGGDRGGVVVVVRDLSAAKAMEEERRRLDRLALLGEMSAVVAHEIRNPLAGIGAGVQHLLGKLTPDDKQRESLEMIQKETERVNRIIEEILIISRPVRLNLAPCNLAEILEEVLAGLEPRLKGAEVRARKYYAPAAPWIKADAMRLNQAFTNLISNALEAMGKGGELRIVVAEEDKGELEVEIRDNGAGIKKEDLPRIFEPFYTTKPGGTGLGLAIVKRIIEEHGGRISVESEEGKRTTFAVHLPVKK
ncbi:MAG: PAS domain S-box protein [Chloroflexi bacterium]|nr:PAS domain S-box protein [Chloroflexota bacterium]